MDNLNAITGPDRIADGGRAAGIGQHCPRSANALARCATGWRSCTCTVPRRNPEAEQAVAEADGLLHTFNALLRIARTSRSTAAGSRRSPWGTCPGRGELYEPIMEEKRQTLELQLTEELHVNGDRDLLFQAIANLMDNATKYTPAGGCIRIDLARQNGKGRLVIADSGPGIPEAAREKVFQRFFRLEQSRTTPGNGLGMSLVAAVIKLHRMSIRWRTTSPACGW
jgi:signal transduction histidine kinase